MTKLILDHEFYVETDTLNFILTREVVSTTVNDKTGKPTISRDRWYLPNLKACLVRYLVESMRDNASIKEVIVKIDSVHETIKNLK